MNKSIETLEVKNQQFSEPFHKKLNLAYNHLFVKIILKNKDKIIIDKTKEPKETPGRILKLKNKLIKPIKISKTKYHASI